MTKLTLLKRLSSLSFALALSLLIACGATTIGREARLGESFKLEPKEKVSIKDTKLVLQLMGVRRSWRADGKGEYVDAEIITTLNAAEQKQWMKSGDEVRIGDYQVKLLGADPFGKTNAELIVTRR